MGIICIIIIYPARVFVNRKYSDNKIQTNVLSVYRCVMEKKNVCLFVIILIVKQSRT